MRTLFRKLVSAALAAVLFVSPLTAYASDALGHDLAAKSVELNTGVELVEGTFWSDSYSDLRQENYVVYTPNERVTPVVAYGETTRSLTSTLAAARALEAQGLRVVAGINGDYYGTAHGVPLGSTMVDGALRNANHDPYYAVGFRADGTALIGNPQITMKAVVNGGSGFDIFAFNHIRQSEYGIFLYDSRFNSRGTTGTSEAGVDVVCSVTGGALAIGGTLALRVDEVLSEATDTAVDEGKYVLTANLRATEGYDYTAPLLALQPGDEVTIRVSSDGGEAWNDVVNLIGAPELLVENGAVRPGLPPDRAPRTAIGQRADGSLVFYTIDGRQSGYSIGATLTAVAMRLVELDCVTAVALDGGGSTTLAATMPDETSARVVNTPSDGGVRAVSNHVFLVAPGTASGVLDHVYLAPAVTRALPGAQVALAAAAIDTNYIPMDASVTLTADKGSLSGSTLTLPADAGTVTVTASYNGKSASAEIEAAVPQSITLTRGSGALTSLTVSPDASVKLTAEAWSNHLKLAGNNRCFAWAYEGGGAAVSADGTLTAGKDAAAGTLTVSLGGKSVSIPVTVSVRPLKLLADFEAASDPAANDEESPQLTLSQAVDAARVKFGRASAKLDYTLGDGESVTLPVGYALDPGYNCVELWVCGDGSGVMLTLETDAGASVPVPLGFTGWGALSITLPKGAKSVTGITLSTSEAMSGAIWLDQLVLAYDNLVDAVAPAVSLTLDEETNTLTGRAFDAVDGAALTTLRLAYDGAALAYAYDKRTGALSAALPGNDGLAHHVTLTAGDAAGNLARTSVYIPAAADIAPAFPDLAGHWSAGAAEYLKRTGVTNGSDGLYKPDANITRQEFATMIYRYLKPAADYSGVELPFYDNAKIAPWALDAAKAMYALGVVGGGKDADGRLCYMPQSNITRQEAATMLGRLFEQGYAAPAPAYTDAASIAGWAAGHVALLASIGALDDFVDGTFAPTAPLTRAEMASMLLRIN